MFVIDVNEQLKLDEIVKSGFTRFPVIDGDIDHVVGILNIKDLLRHQAIPAEEIDVRKIMREAYFVPENKKLDSLLRRFKKRKQHMAIIVDEHGGVSGLITLEDTLEEIVGEIIDETDTFEPHIVKLKKDEWRVLGKSEIDEVNDKIPINIPIQRNTIPFPAMSCTRSAGSPRKRRRFRWAAFLSLSMGWTATGSTNTSFARRKLSRSRPRKQYRLHN